MSMKDLDGVTAFLSGPIDRVQDDGVGWRKEIKKLCKRAKLPIEFLDPTDKPIGLGSEIGEEKLRIQKLMREKKWDQAKEQAKIFRHYDLRMVDRCHLYIGYIDVNVHMCGSYDELFTAERQEKPLLGIMAPGQSKWDIPSWLVAIFKEEEVFDSVEDCVEHLKLLHEGKLVFDRRWVAV
jgi:hypothetical protein